MSSYSSNHGNKENHCLFLGSCFISNSLQELMSVSDVLIIISPAG